MNFPSQKESEKAIYKFDKESYEKNTLLVTSVGFCPCLDNGKYKRQYTGIFVVVGGGQIPILNVVYNFNSKSIFKSIILWG